MATPFEMPDRSQLMVRGTGAAHRRPVAGGAGARRSIERIEAPAAGNATDVSELKLEMRKSGTETVHAGGMQLVSWPFQVIPDHPPKIAITKEPEKSPRGALKLSFKVEDDYGVVSAESRIKRGGRRRTRPRPPGRGPERRRVRARRTSGRRRWRCGCRAPIPSRPKARASTRSAIIPGRG